MQNLDDLKQAAIEARKALLLPKFIKSANIEICWTGRISRGMDLANEALISGDKDKAEKIKLAIQQIEVEMDAVRATADAALKAYQDAGGIEAIDVGICACEYCQRSNQQDALFLAESRLRRAVFDLTEPDDDGKPLPLALMSEGTEDAQKRAWKLYMTLCNAQANYLQACTQTQRKPAWGYVLRAW